MTAAGRFLGAAGTLALVTLVVALLCRRFLPMPRDLPPVEAEPARREPAARHGRRAATGPSPAPGGHTWGEPTDKGRVRIKRCQDKGCGARWVNGRVETHG